MDQTPYFYKIFQLAEHYSQASKLLNDQAEKIEWGSSAPKLLVDSFAVELYLKCLYVLDFGKKPRYGHNLKKLFNNLSPYTKKAIRETFNRIIDNNPVLSNLAVINPEALKAIDFERSLNAVKNTFDKRRYLYEPQQSKEWYYTYLLHEAIRTVTKMDVRLTKSNNQTT